MSTQQQRVSSYLPRNIITPITGVLSLIIGLSGVMLFFHFGEGLVKGVHEWLGIAFAVIMLVHLGLNWSAFKKHFSKPAAWVGTGVVTSICAIVLVASLSNPSGGNPMHAIIQSIETTPVSDLAPVFKISQSEMVKKLGQAGIEMNGRETLQELAGKNGVATRRLIATLMGSTNHETGGKRGTAD